MKKKVIVGMSGGVDSSVSALLLLREGYDVEGLYMRNWDSAVNNDREGNPDLDAPVCPQEVDYADALAVADRLGIVLHRHDFIQEYWDDVFTAFLHEYERGRTPNPDVLCNKHIKFRSFSAAAAALGADFIAMGHYARVEHGAAGTRLFRGADPDKDQSYFLCQLTRTQLDNVLFPVGGLLKSEVRRIAREAGLPTAAKKDSTGICFIGERRFSRFLANYLPAKPGDIVTEDGIVLGRHDGLMNHTIGQRKGLMIGGSRTFGNRPWFVVGKDLPTNRLIVGQGIDHPTLMSDACVLEDFNWIPAESRPSALSCTAKFRYRQPDVPVTVAFEGEDGARVRFGHDVRAVTPGQACVLYRGEECLGGGVIATVFKDGTKRVY
ncbi:MAG: tRNA 2-thiouridine(34) synthase MnmA [Candidatus Izemoplasmatales bacterium]